MQTHDVLLKLMCIPTSQYQDITKTSDGYYIAQEHGDIGYNAFLGLPKTPHDGPGRDQMLETWAGLSRDERLGVLALARARGIDLVGEFGVPWREGQDTG